MSFNKRIVTKESLIRAFNRDGIQGVEKLFQADAIILSGRSLVLLGQIHESLVHLDQEKTYKLIKNLIEE